MIQFFHTLSIILAATLVLSIAAGTVPAKETTMTNHLLTDMSYEAIKYATYSVTRERRLEVAKQLKEAGCNKLAEELLNAGSDRARGEALRKYHLLVMAPGNTFPTDTSLEALYERVDAIRFQMHAAEYAGWTDWVGYYAAQIKDLWTEIAERQAVDGTGTVVKSTIKIDTDSETATCPQCRDTITVFVNPDLDLDASCDCGAEWLIATCEGRFVATRREV